MPDTLVLFDDFIDNAHDNLQTAWHAWKRAQRTRYAVDEYKKSLELVETLARETRIWIFSMLADSRELPNGLRTPSAKSAFGSEVNLLRQLMADHRLCALAESKPDVSSNYVRLQKVFELVKTYNKSADATAEQFERQFDTIERDSRETWLETVEAFVPFRNLNDHRTSQLDSAGAPIAVTERMEQVAPFVASAMKERMRWMMSVAAAHIGRFELRSTKDVAADKHETVSDLRRKKQFGSSSANYWYVRYDDRRDAQELFARLETDEQVSAAISGDETDSAIFSSARDGTLLPLIGPAFGLPEKPHSPGAVDVLRRVSAVVNEKRYATLSEFLSRLASYRLNIDVHDCALVPAGPCNPRHALAGELAFLASQASVAFGHSLAKSGSPIAANGEVLDEAEAAALTIRIREVKEYVVNLLRTIPERERNDLGAYGILGDLTKLETEIGDKRLSLSAVSWLEDIVWHALRWDAPLYPDSEALDLQLSLGSRRQDGGPALLSRAPASCGAALLIEEKRLFDYFEKWSSRMERRIREAHKDATSSGWRDPYKLVAKAMVLCLEMRQTGAVDVERPGQKKNVFVVDATFDQRMCTALEEEERAMVAVVYPIDLVDRSNNRYPAWAMRRSPRPTNSDVYEYAILWDDCGRIINWQDTPRIIVLKPFGAPLERISQLAEATKLTRRELKDFQFPVPEDLREDITVEHRYLFDDVSILKDMLRRQDSMPPGLRHALHDDVNGPSFQFFFLGYTIDEYGRRARMVADVRPENDDGREYRSKVLYLSHPPPSGLVLHYLERAGAQVSDTSLPTAMRELELSLKQYKREARP